MYKNNKSSCVRKSPLEGFHVGLKHVYKRPTDVSRLHTIPPSSAICQLSLSVAAKPHTYFPRSGEEERKKSAGTYKPSPFDKSCDRRLDIIAQGAQAPPCILNYR